MKRFLPLVALSFLLSIPQLSVAGDAKVELQDLIGKIKTKVEAGKKTEPELADELHGFDELLAKHAGEKTDDVAQILFMEAIVYTQLLDNDAKATDLLNKAKTDFPDTSAAKHADGVLASLKAQEAAKKIQKSLIEGNQFPDFDEKDLSGNPLSIASRKGKIVLVDFWATWCGPCVHELPNVIKAFEKFHDKGFEIIGVSLDQDKDKLTSFIKEKNMNWPQYFDGLGWKNKLAAKYGINSIPATYLLDKDGKIIGKDLRGPALESALAKAIVP
jgi:peroxiredoxin